MKELNLICFFINVVIALSIAVFLPLIPSLTRKSYLFGVKVPTEAYESSDAKDMKKRYRFTCYAGSICLLALIALQYIFLPNKTVLASLYFPLLFMGVQMTAFIPNWKKTLQLKAQRGWAVSASVFAETKSSHTRGNLSELPWIWYILSFLCIAASFVIALVQYPTLPERIPTHFDMHMQPDIWADKSIFTILTMPLINLFTLLIFLLTAVMIVRARLQVDPQSPALSFAQHRLYRKRVGHSIGFLALSMTVMLALIGFLTIWANTSFPFWLMIVLLLVPIIPAAVVPVASGQGGCRIRPKSIPDETAKPAGSLPPKHGLPDRSDDKFWRLGMFYYNPSDPGYFIEDRFGGNMGFNYARLPVKISVSLLLLALAVTYVWLTVFLWTPPF